MGEKIRVLIVDDSVVFRTQIRAALERSDQIEVVSVANHGKIALQKLAQLSVDSVTLDMEMPEMDGLETIKEIKRQGFKVRIIIFSSQTQRGSEAALNALSLGADDFLAKPDLSNLSNVLPEEKIAQELIPKILQFANNGVSAIEVKENKVNQPQQSTPITSKKNLQNFKPSIIVIGSSTGGPQTLEKVLTGVSKPLRCPILIAQHMPPVFTASLAKRLAECSGVLCREGQDMEEIQSNHIYVAPGDFHMKLVKMGESIRISLDKGPLRNSVRPAVDPLFESAANIFKSNCFGMILTGMGEDGLLGCRSIKSNGGAVAIQNKETSVVFGMPGAVFTDGSYDDIAPPEKLNLVLKQMTQM